MANDFSGDSSCKALWRFESGALTTDSKSTNTLSNSGVSEETTNHMEGSCGALFESANSDYMGIPDANLVSGFPLKNGDSIKKGTFAFWMRPATVPGSGAYAIMVSKWDWAGSKISLEIRLTNSKLGIAWGYGSGTSNETYETATITANTKYHVTVTFDGVNKICYVWVYNNTSGVLSAYAKTFTNALRIVDTDLRIGAEISGVYFNGVLDEIVVLDRMVNQIEAVKIRSGTYAAENNLDALAVHAYVEYQEESKVKIPQVLAEVEWVPTDPNAHIYDGSITFAITPQGSYDPVWEYAGQVTVTVAPAGEYFYQAPGQFEYHGSITLTITPDSETILGYCYKPSGIPIGITVQSNYLFPDRFYESPGIELTITPFSTYRIPTPGWDIPSGYGCVDFTDLQDPPPFWVIDTDGLSLAFDNTATSFLVYAEYSWDSDGGVEVGGACEFEFEEPGVAEYFTRGGVEVGGSCNIEVPEPWITALSTSGGVLVQGACEFSFVTPSTTLVTEITTSGGVVIDSLNEYSFVDPTELVTTVTTSGGVVVGGRRYPPIEFVDPAAEDIYYEFTTRGTVYVGGELEFDIPEAPVYEFSIRRGGVVVGGACTFGFWEPPVTEFDIMGGVFVEGSIVEDVELYETYTLTGQGFQPSMYSRFNFNSYAERNGQILAARSDGIYVLEGEDDDGQKVRPGVRLGPTNFGVDNFKGVRAIYPGDCGEEAEVRVEGATKAQEGFYPLDRGRFSVGHEILDRLLIIEISDFEQLSHLEIVTRAKTKGQG